MDNASKQFREGSKFSGGTDSHDKRRETMIFRPANRSRRQDDDGNETQVAKASQYTGDTDAPWTAFSGLRINPINFYSF